ncbi:hypothetical protein Taro_045991 [Colocasia esculenta]|uniref:Uncharacterized protein n=1 Tax=Colocasia esculenta TaxID=4460 RepID=A0A843WSM3_COLES|nr:hypothetical protein [Colocasia esculenta]
MRATCRAWSGAADVRSGKASPEAVAIRSCCGSIGRLGVSVVFSARSRRGNVAWSQGDAMS